ncbi:MAG TPA: glycosyltransferase family 2 protein [Candidatus Acidoferrales bacterium]|nr:glycosyltransferase family 2 protein [Candidatus Acidoferrales bacterium]
MKYSIVVPFCNEQGNVAEVYRETKAVMEATADDFEFVFVDDGSTDQTFSILEEIANKDGRVIVVKLRRNYGKTEALVAGFDHATGDCVVAMDGDLQHDAHDIPLFLQKIDEGFDVVCGCRIARPGDSLLLKRIPSKVANWLMAKLTGVDIHDFGGGFKAYRTEVIRQVPLYGEFQRFIPALAATYGATICEVPIRINERRHGKSHYGFGRVLPTFFDLITIPFLLRYISRPMHFFGAVGLTALASGSAIAAWLFAELLAGMNVAQAHGPLMFFTMVLILAGLQLVCLGLLGEMNVRHFHLRNAAPRDSGVLRVVRKQ